MLSPDIKMHGLKKTDCIGGAENIESSSDAAFHF